MAIVVLQFFEESSTQHTLTFAVDEDNATAFVFGILTHRVVESLDLHHQDVGWRQTLSGVEQHLSVQIHFHDRVAVERHRLVCSTSGLLFRTFCSLAHHLGSNQRFFHCFSSDAHRLGRTIFRHQRTN